MADITMSKFLQEKADNFRVFLNANQPDSDLQEQMASFQSSQLIQTVVTMLLPLSKLGQISTAVDGIMEHLSPAADDVEAVKHKVGRYLQCFVDVVSDSS
jgi:hypothetical protein